MVELIARDLRERDLIRISKLRRPLEIGKHLFVRKPTGLRTRTTSQYDI
jgi:hypothetical protein